MPIQFRYYPARDLLIHSGEGAVTIEEIEDLRRERSEHGVPVSVANTLTDMRGAHFTFDPRDLRENEEGKPVEHFAGSRHAEIVTDPHQTAISRLVDTAD